MQQVDQQEKKRRGRPKKSATEEISEFWLERYQSETIEEFRKTIARQDRLIKTLILEIEKKRLSKQPVGAEQ